MDLGDQYGLRCLTRPQSSPLPWMVTKAMDIDTDPGCRAMDSDMAPVAVQAWMSSCPPVAVQATKINMAPVAAWPLNIKMAIGGGPYPGHHCGLGGNVSHGYQHRLRLSNKLPTSARFSPSLLQNCLLPQNMIHASLLTFPFHHHIVAHHIGTQLPDATRSRVGM